MQPEWMSVAMGSNKDVSYSFDQVNGLQIHAPDSMGPSQQEYLKKKNYKYSEPDPLYDEDADEEDEKWMQNKRLTMRLGASTETSANLVCPCCFSCLCCDNRLVGKIKDNVWEALVPPTENCLVTEEEIDTCPVSSSLKPHHSHQLSEADMKADLKAMRWWSPEDEVTAAPPTPFLLEDDPLERDRSSGRRSKKAKKKYSIMKCRVCSIDVGFVDKYTDRYYITGVVPSEI
eukprot:TRINITY_DN16688_c0_g1_i2.p1 TRINITY_DN16688_c0_g1~~TRINITY_DN16688_c0_g1_i2.p1  ORF type:complete len:247 (+),score=48.93 TRINITY_DN16688_c0_g1_i2:50-742(+)